MFVSRHLDIIQDILGLAVGQTMVGADDCSANLVANDLCLLVHFEDNRHAEFIFVRSETTELVAELFGQHGDNSIHEIDAGSTLVCLIIEGCKLVDIVGHICDVDTNLVVACIENLEGNSIVEILCFVWVNGESECITHVAATHNLVLRNRSGEFLRLEKRFLGKRFLDGIFHSRFLRSSSLLFGFLLVAIFAYVSLLSTEFLGYEVFCSHMILAASRRLKKFQSF